MSVPHLDTRFINNKKSHCYLDRLPASHQSFFKKTGSMFDLVTSVKADNLLTMLSAGAKKHVIDKIPDPASYVIKRKAHGRVT
ncbi:hypothetical protein GCM10020331_030740 [Ectobacillus funiculus]